IRTGTSTCTSRNGRIRMRRMYSSRLIRLAARSNWLSTIDFPVMVRAGRPVAVNGPPSESGGLEAAAGEPAGRVLGLGQGVGDVDLTRAAARGVGQHADHVGTRGRGLRDVLEHEHEARGVLGHGR